MAARATQRPDVRHGLERAAFETCWAQRDEKGRLPRVAVEELVDTWRLIPLIEFRVALAEAREAIPWIEAEVQRRTLGLLEEVRAARRAAALESAKVAVLEAA